MRFFGRSKHEPLIFDTSGPWSVAQGAYDGKPMVVGHESTRGKTPRTFTVDPTGTFLFAANQNSGTLAAFRIDAAHGTLHHLRTTPVGASPYWVGVVMLAGG